MAKMKLKKPILLQEEFAAGEVSNPNQNATPAVQTNTNTVGIDKTAGPTSGEEVRAEIVKDVDTILTNLEALSKQITESADGLVMEEDAIAKIFISMKSGIAIAKCESKFKNYEKLLLQADANMQSAKTAQATKELKDALKAKKDKLSGKQLEIFNAKSDKQMAKFEAQAEYEKERNKNVLSEFEAELTEDEENISKDSVLGKLYFRKKQMLKNQVAEEGVATNAKIQMALKNDATAEKLEQTLKGLQDKQNELAKDIADGKKEGAEDLKELEGIKAYIKEITALQTAAAASRKIGEEAKKAAVGISESFYATWASENAALLEGAVADLFSKAKGANDAAALAQAKSLAGKLKAAADAEYKAKAALVQKIQGKEVPKTIVILAGGDGDSAKEGENGYTLGEFIPKWGEGSTFVKPEDFGPMKDVAEVEANVDDAIAAAKAKEEKEKGTKGATDEAPADETPAEETPTKDGDAPREMTDKEKENLKKAEASLAKAQEAGDEDKIERYKKLIAGIKDTSKLGEDFDIDAEISEIEEGNAFGAARAEAIAKGEKTFKVGDEEYPVEDVGAEDKENAEEYAEEEGIATEAVTESSAFKMGSVADRFRSLL